MKDTSIDFILGGTVTSPKGFCAGATYAGIKQGGTRDKPDLGILFSEAPAVIAGVFTTNQIKSAPVLLCRQRLALGKAVAVVANSGCANACTGEPGMADAVEMAAMTAKALGAEPEDILVASTGVTGHRLPMKLIEEGIHRIMLSPEGGHDLARAIMTTDTVPKEVAVTVKADGVEFTIGGVAKGSGMIHPNMATMLSFLTTDAAVGPSFLRSALKKAADISFNMVTVDGDTSPSDTFIIMANGQADNQPVAEGSRLAEAFQQALDKVSIYLAKRIAGDGEGATRLIEVTVDGAVSAAEARTVARTIITSPLVKAAVHGADPNWGRIIVAAGYSGARVVESKIDLDIGDVSLLRAGKPLPFSGDSVVRVFERSEVPIRLNLNLGTASATAWGCDLSEEYVTINSQYMT